MLSEKNKKSTIAILVLIIVSILIACLFVFGIDYFAEKSVHSSKSKSRIQDVQRARYNNSQKYHYVLFDKNGKMVNDEEYEYALYFYHDRYSVKSKYAGVINGSWKYIVKPEYTNIRMAGKDKYIASKCGAELTGNDNNSCKYYILDKNGKVNKEGEYFASPIINVKEGTREFIYSYDKMPTYRNTAVKVDVLDNNLQKLFSYIDTQTPANSPHNIIKAKYMHVVDENGMLRILDFKGKDVIRRIYNKYNWAIEKDNKIYFIVEKDFIVDDKHGYSRKALVSEDGKELIPPKYRSFVYNENSDYLYANVSKNIYDCYDFSGNLIKENIYVNSKIQKYNDQNHYAVYDEDNNLVCYINKDEIIPIPVEYYIRNGQYYFLSPNRRKYLYNNKGKRLFAADQWGSELKDCGDYFILLKGSKYRANIYDKKLKKIIYSAPIYCNLRYKNDGIFEIRDDKKGLKLITDKGKPIIEFNYTDMKHMNVRYDDSKKAEYLYKITNDDKVGIINHRAEIIIPIEYQEIKLTFNQDDNIFLAKKYDKWMLIDDKNKIILKTNISTEPQNILPDGSAFVKIPY